MMRNAFLAATVLWALVPCATATAVTMKNIENAFELDPSQVLLPAHASGQLVIRECPGCKPVVLRVDRETRYLVGPAAMTVPLAALRKAVAEDASRHRLLTVFYSLDTGRVTRVQLSGE